MKRTTNRYLIICLLFAGWGCRDSDSTTRQTVAIFRGDAQHSGVYTTKAVHNFKEVKWAFKTDGAVRSTPAVAGGAVYFGSGDGYLYAVDLQSGQEKWRFKTEGAVHSSPAIFNGVVYFTSRDGGLYAVDAQTGELRLKFQTGEALPYSWGFDYYVSSPLVADGLVYFGSADGHLYALDIRRGRPKWKFNAKSRIRSSPALADNVIYFGDMKGYFYAIDRETGAQKWRFETAGVKFNPAEFGFDRCAIVSSAAISGDLVTFGGRDGFFTRSIDKPARRNGGAIMKFPGSSLRRRFSLAPSLPALRMAATRMRSI
jgi:outer membrane protein assembly factor BamB